MVFVTGCTELLGSWTIQEVVTPDANAVGLVRNWVSQSRLFAEGITAADERLVHGKKRFDCGYATHQLLPFG